MVSLGTKPAGSESVPAAPDKAVVPVIGAGGAAWLLATLPVAVPAGSKKSCPASTAEAATNDVLASVPIAVFSAAFRFAAVAAGVAPMAKLPAGSGVELEAVNTTESVVPSGRLKVMFTCCPELGLVAPRLIDIAS